MALRPSGAEQMNVGSTAIPQQSHVWNASIASSRRRLHAEASKRPCRIRPLIGRRCHRSGGGRMWPHLGPGISFVDRYAVSPSPRLPYGTFAARPVASRECRPPTPTTAYPCDGRQTDFGWMGDLQPAFNRRQAATTVDGRWRLARSCSPALHFVIGRRRGRDPGSTSSMGKAGTCSLASSRLNKPL